MQDRNEEVQVYVSHVTLHNTHPIFSKFLKDTVKAILNFSQVIYLSRGQTLYAPGYNENFFYVVLFGACKLFRDEQPIGMQMNIGWTLGEEILFKPEKPAVDSYDQYGG